MNIAFLGNSHAGPILRAWKKHKSISTEITIDFFIERSTAVQPLSIRGVGGSISKVFDDILVLPRNELQIDSYDAFFVAGLGIGFHPIVSLYRRLRSDLQVEDPKLDLVSESCYEQIVCDAFAATKAGRVAHELTTLSAAPVTLIPQPYSAEWIREANNSTGTLYRMADDNGDLRHLHRSYLNWTQTATAGYRLVSQPSETVSDRFFTKNAFALGDPNDTSENSYYARGDYSHGNAGWGELVLRDALRVAGA